MPRRSERPELKLDEDQRMVLLKISQSRTGPVREVQRASILLKYAAGESITGISEDLNVSRPTAYKCIDKALAAGLETGLKDKYHRARSPIITEEAQMWVIDLACSKPVDHGYAAEIWSLSQLARHTRQHAPAAGYKCLAHAAKATIQRILKSHPIQPHKIRYYLEQRDPEFQRKMQEVLIVYREVNAINDSNDANNKIITVSVDEKPGIQAIENVAPDLPPVPGKYTQTGRDYEYKRHGTLSLLAALDLHTGHVFGQVHERHRSREFILLLKELDEYYPADSTIRVILDNHSAHISKETMGYLKSRPNRFIYVHTPKHGSWLNLVETYFSKIARTFLKHIRVHSKGELKERILQGIAETNAEPIVHRWKNFDFGA